MSHRWFDPDNVQRNEVFTLHADCADGSRSPLVFMDQSPAAARVIGELDAPQSSRDLSELHDMGAEHIAAMTGILAPPPEVPPATKLADYPATEVGQTRISQVQRLPRQQCYGDWFKLMESEEVATPSQVLEVHYHVVVSPNCALQMLQRFKEQAIGADAAWSLPADLRNTFRRAFYGNPLPRCTR